jgi:hypothetical protein
LREAFLSYRALIGTVTVGSVPEGNYLRVIGLKVLFPDDFWTHSEDDHHKGAHQVAAVCLLIVLVGTEMVYLRLFELRVLPTQSEVR